MMFLAAGLIVLLGHVTIAAQPRCSLQNTKEPGYAHYGDIDIGAVFSVHYANLNPAVDFTKLSLPNTCKIFTTRAFRWVQAVIFTVNEINQNPVILPNVTLGFRIQDSCYEERKVIRVVMNLLSGYGVPSQNFRCEAQPAPSVIIGDVYSSINLMMARLLGVFRFPQISHGSNLHVLSDKIQYPSFMRTLPNSKMTSRAIIRLLMHFGWTWVGLISLEKGAAQSTMDLMKDDFLQAGACIAFLEDLPVSYSKERTTQVVQMLKKSSANAIVAIATEPFLVTLLEELARQNVTGKVWIANHSWASSSLLATTEFSRVLAGTIGFASQRGIIPGLKELLYSLNSLKHPEDPFTRKFWEQAFACKWPSSATNVSNAPPPCTGSERVQDLNENVLDVNNFRLTYNVYNAVYATAYALHDLHSCQPGKGPFLNRACAGVHNFKPWQLLHYLKKVRFINPTGEEVFFDENGDPPGVYDILNWHRMKDGSILHVKVGTYNNSAPYNSRFVINESAIMWNEGGLQIPVSVCSKPCSPGFRRASQQGQANCCYDCVPCSEEEISNPEDSASCSPCPPDQMPSERRNRCIPKTIEYLSFQEPLGIVLAAISLTGCLLTVFIVVVFITHNQTPVVKANNLTLSFFLLLALTLCFACPLMFIGQPNSLNCMLRQVSFGTAFALCVSCVLAKTVTVVLAFRATKPNSRLQKWFGLKVPYCITFAGSLIQLLICISWLILSPPFQQLNFQYSLRKILNECNEGSSRAFWLMLGYMALLATVSLLVAFLARNLPDSFNEAKLITFSMLVFVSVWVAFVPAYLSTRGKFMVAVENFAILASSSGLLGCIFFPKCYTILLRPEMNTRNHIMGRAKSVKEKNQGYRT